MKKNKFTIIIFIIMMLLLVGCKKEQPNNNPGNNIPPVENNNNNNNNNNQEQPPIKDNNSELYYEVKEFKFSELKSISKYFLELENDKNLKPCYYIMDDIQGLKNLFDNEIGKNLEEYLPENILDENIILVFARYGQEISNYGFFNFKPQGPAFTISEEITNKEIEVNIDYYVDLIIIPKNSFDYEQFKEDVNKFN